MPKDSLPQTICLSDYTPSSYLIDRTDLRVELYDDRTLVAATLQIRRNGDDKATFNGNLTLNAEAMEVVSVKIDGMLLQSEKGYKHTNDELCIFNVGEQFILETQVQIHPENNTSLMGLYKSRTMFCTQCEAEGFRKITPYLDRPDVMSEFSTTVIADKSKYPVLLSNGNPVQSADLGDGRHSVTWHDPFRKPAYLFALVAGDLQHIEDSFTTMSGRDIAIKIFVEPKDLDKCSHALRSLKASMKWDEETYGREYDLDIFMIVAVDDFNMGAMENKGLNIFNTSAVLAHQKTTTDMRFQWVEAVVAHEYFHNWSGNRVTCRDWFQLSLKEGFTVYRDSEFSADLNSRTVKRIEDVRTLRAHQFAEDGGPLAHPVQPDSYMEINNFYTLTVYEKGAEIVRMQANLLGPELFRKGTDLYFQRHDGCAITIEDFVACMEEVSGMDLTQFKRWYKQAGTPVLDVSSSYDADKQEYTLSFSQSCPATPESKDKKPFVIPVRMGLLSKEKELPMVCKEAGLNGQTDAVLQIKDTSQHFVFSGVASEPVPSLLRGFSAPVKINYQYEKAALCLLISNDSDGFNRWDAMQRLSVMEIEAQQALIASGQQPVIDEMYVETVRTLLLGASPNKANIDKAMLALMVVLPSVEYLAEMQAEIDLDSLYAARSSVRQVLARQLASEFKRLYSENNIVNQDYQPNSEQIAARSLKNACLGYWLASGDSEALEAALGQFDNADNMTDQSSALSMIVNTGSDVAQKAACDGLERFYAQWQHEGLVVNQWLAIQAGSVQPNGLERIQALMNHEIFDLKNPNKARALIGSFCGLNPHNFHNKNGSGYKFVADQVIALNVINPQMASRLVNPLSKWRKVDGARAELMKAELMRIAKIDDLSSDLREVITKSL